MVRKPDVICIVLWLSFFGVGCSEDLIQPLKVVLYSISPVGGPPGAVIRVSGDQFSSVPEENVATVNGLSAEVLAASDTLLTIKIPEQAVYVKTELIVASSGLAADTIQVIVSENPLAEINSITPIEGPPGTIVTVLGKNFNLDIASYAVIYEDPEEGFIIPRNEDGTLRSTLRAAYSDSLLIQIPEGFREGRIRIITETKGKPLDTNYVLFTPQFTVTQ